MASYSFTLEPIAPFRLDLTVWVLRRRPDNQIDRWDGQTYERILVIDGEPLFVSVTQIGTPENSHLEVVVIAEKANSDTELQVRTSLERLLGVRVDLQHFYQFSEGHADLNILVKKFQGVKPPRFPTLFEPLVNAIACQQLSLDVGIKLLNRLSQNFGLAFQTEAGVFHAFPRPEDLVDADLEEFRRMGFSYRKGEYVLNVARLIGDRQLNLDEMETLTDRSAIEQLCLLKGVGRWTSEYFLLRGLGRTHIFPGDDVGARNHLERWLAIPRRLNYDDVKNTLIEWQEYGGLIYFHLLLKSLVEKGIVRA
jgi:DNA-3-methyladenine glycosylase II